MTLFGWLKVCFNLIIGPQAIYLFLLMVIFLLVFGFGRVWSKTGLGIILPGGIQSWCSSFGSFWRSSLLIGCLWRRSPLAQSTRLTPLLSLWTAWLSSWYRWITTWSRSSKVGFTTTWVLIPVIAKISIKISQEKKNIDRFRSVKIFNLPNNWTFMTLISMNISL